MRTKERINITITPDVRDRGAEVAADLGLSLSGYIEQILRAELERVAAEKLKAAENRRRR